MKFGDVCIGGLFSPHFPDPFTMFLGLGIFLDGLVCQIVLLRIGPKLLNNNYAFGTHVIQQIPREVGVNPCWNLTDSSQGDRQLTLDCPRR